MSTPGPESQRIPRADWLGYYALLTLTLLAVLLVSGDIDAALVAAFGTVLTSTHTAAMMRRAYARRGAETPTGGDS